MTEQTAATKAIEAAQQVAEAAIDTAATAAKPAAEAATAVAKSSISEVKQPARKAAAAKRSKAARPAAKAAPAKKPAGRKNRPVVTARPATRTTRPARAGSSKGAKTMTKQTNGIDSGLFAAEQFKNVFGDVNERAKAAAERSAKIAEELADLTRGNVEAFVASSKIAAKGVEALSQDAAEYSRKSFEEASAALKGFAEVKSATDFFKLQGDYARAAFDNAVAESARLSETVLKLAGDVAEPITSRYTVAAERVKTLAA